MKPDPLALPCPRCRAAAGRKCRDYRGVACAPHRDRRRPDEAPAPAIFDQADEAQPDEAPAQADELPRDLFGRPIFGAGPRLRQAALFDARHWFTLGYMDRWTGKGRDSLACDAYRRGFDAAGRDMADDDRDSNCNPARAFDQACAVGIIERS